MSESKKKRISQKELAWYIVAGVIATIALVFIIFGIIGNHYQGKASDNWVQVSEKAWLVNWSNMGYRWWGIVLMAIAAFIAIVTLLVFARSGDRDEERALRRRQRLMLEEEASKEAHPEIVNAEATPKE